MATAGSTTATFNPRVTAALILFTLLQAIVVFALFPYPYYYALTQENNGLEIMAVVFALFVPLTVAGFWMNKPWSLWAALLAVTCAATLVLFSWSRGDSLTILSTASTILVLTTALVFRAGSRLGPTVGRYQRALFGCVLLFAAWVAVWGLFLPARIGEALPIAAPPLHARFLGVMYLSGATFMLFGMLAQTWSEVRVVTLILAVWTGLLGFVSVLNLIAFDWSRKPTWFWFFAYIGYPLIALWIVWCQRRENEHPAGPPLSSAVLTFLYLLGTIATVLALALLLAPHFMVTIWPWRAPVLLAQIYGAPFLAYGLGSLYAARQRTWSEVSIPVLGMLVFAMGVLAASTLHRNLFQMDTLSAWLWFGGFGLISLIMAALLTLPSLRTRG
jgi:hypothetical protein